MVAGTLRVWVTLFPPVLIRCEVGLVHLQFLDSSAAEDLEGGELLPAGPGMF